MVGGVYFPHLGFLTLTNFISLGQVYAHVHVDGDVQRIFKISIQVNTKVGQVLLKFRDNITHYGPSLFQLLVEVIH